jgi:leader peptidase (prepilin peptidase) / N-methyltransferase
MIFLPIIVFGFGLIIGSFLNVVILRLNTGRSIAKGRSKCARCSNTLSWYELIPVFSFLGLGGKCRSCKVPISFQYPVVELVTGILFVLLYGKIFGMYELSFASLFVFIFSIVIACLLLVITMYDFRHKIIPDKIVYPFIALAFVSVVWNTTSTLGFAFLPAIVAGPLLAAPFFFLYFFSKGRAMGFGDVKLALGIGWLVGIVGAISVFLLSFWIGAIVGVVLMAFSKRHGIKSEIPFAPFMIVATAIVSILGVGIQTFFPIWF